MGIPVYFKTLISQYQDDILVKHSVDIDVLCLDLNCLIHPCCRSVMSSDDPTNEDKMIETILASIETIIAYTNLSDTLYISIDGVAPKAKMKQQRQRRHKSIYEKKPWDTNAITPGTEFMNDLSTYLQKVLKTDSYFKTIPTCILSDASVPGEGEHKILQYLRNLL